MDSKVKSITCSLSLLLASSFAVYAQGTGAMTLGQIEPVSAKAGSAFTQKIPLHLKSGYHCNSNTPAEDYLIPLRLTWTPGPATADQTVYPKPLQENFAFSPKPVSVYSGTFVIETKFRVPADAPKGPAKVKGKLRYQACSDKECLPPKTIEIEIPLQIE